MPSTLTPIMMEKSTPLLPAGPVCEVSGTNAGSEDHGCGAAFSLRWSLGCKAVMITHKRLIFGVRRS